MSGTTAKATLQEKNVETVTTTTVTVEETVATLDLHETKTLVSPSVKSTSTKAMESSLHRELPIFSNPLLANATQGNSVPIKAKTGRVKSGGKSVSVLRINAPKVDGDVVVMRRLDTDLVNATSMFNAAYPAISEKMNTKERDFITRKYEGVFEKSGALSGVWITISQAKELAKEYGIDQFMRPLLDTSNSKGEEITEKMVVSEVTLVQTDMEDDQQILEETQEMEETTDKLQDLTVADVAGMKRRIEELEEQVSRDKKKLRGLVTVAVGFAAATVIPQVLPYFS
ncbi:hypothetical protein EDD21DRAFT_376732 [Dissophora ornata]|nr:hypothetical protein BGZ58_004546 [Dissophora ornata]KAI8600584.1 hypothetical protein EDD21DRAFT_376732 [Dissophora ornata]